MDRDLGTQYQSFPQGLLQLMLIKEKGRERGALGTVGMAAAPSPGRYGPQQALHLHLPEPGGAVDPRGPGMAGTDPAAGAAAPAQVLPALAAQQGPWPQGQSLPRPCGALQTSEDPHLGLSAAPQVAPETPA